VRAKAPAFLAPSPLSPPTPHVKPFKSKEKTHPTLTQHPPLNPFSISSVFFPYHPAALLAYHEPHQPYPLFTLQRRKHTVPDPPLPPPITIYSNASGSFGGIVLIFLFPLEFQFTRATPNICLRAIKGQDCKCERIKVSLETKVLILSLGF
jgi:hypothetical protein